MRNRAKCKLCSDIIESFHRHDFVHCSCGEISVDGGNDYFRCGAKNWKNFLRLDDNDNEIVVTFIDESNKDKQEEEEVIKPLTKSEKIDGLDEMVKMYENLPPNALYSSVTASELAAVLKLLVSILRD